MQSLSSMQKLTAVLSFRPSTGGTVVDEVTQSMFRREQERLYSILTGDKTLAAIDGASFRWKQDYIVARAKSVWNDLAVKVLNELDNRSIPSELRAKTQLFALVVRVVDLIRSSPDVTLEDIVEGLGALDEKLHENNLPRLLGSDPDGLCVYLVFHVVGWITALWDPVFNQDCKFLAVADDHSKSRKRSLLHTPTIRHLDVRLTERNTPIYQLVTRFGDLFPNSDSLLSEHDLGGVDVESACITAAYVSFHNLMNVLNVKLQWTNTLNQHLEYDRRRNVLHVFSNPSICEQNLQLGTESILVKLFEQYRQGRDNGNLAYQYADFRIYLTEILVSYRLIFGLHKKSRKAIQPLLPTGKPDGRYGTDCDPLLWTLCTKENTCPEMKALFLELGVENIGNYVSLEEFQFLGRRLLRLERISKSQNASGLRKFWNDRRDSTAWFATWAVIILGGGTLILQAFQLVFQIWQPLQ